MAFCYHKVFALTSSPPDSPITDSRKRPQVLHIVPSTTHHFRHWVFFFFWLLTFAFAMRAALNKGIHHKRLERDSLQLAGPLRASATRRGRLVKDLDDAYERNAPRRTRRIAAQFPIESWLFESISVDLRVDRVHYRGAFRNGANPLLAGHILSFRRLARQPVQSCDTCRLRLAKGKNLPGIRWPRSYESFESFYLPFHARVGSSHLALTNITWSHQCVVTRPALPRCAYLFAPYLKIFRFPRTSGASESLASTSLNKTSCPANIIFKLSRTFEFIRTRENALTSR